MAHFLKVAALSLPLLALKSSVATATRYSVSAVAAQLPTSVVTVIRPLNIYFVHLIYIIELEWAKD